MAASITSAIMRIDQIAVAGRPPDDIVRLVYTCGIAGNSKGVFRRR